MIFKPKLKLENKQRGYRYIDHAHTYNYNHSGNHINTSMPRCKHATIIYLSSFNKNVTHICFAKEQSLCLETVWILKTGKALFDLPTHLAFVVLEMLFYFAKEKFAIFLSLVCNVKQNANMK